MAEQRLITIHTDGASRGNPGPAAYAYVLERDGEDPIEEADRIGRMTNNQAEYTALIRALEHALELGADHRVVVNSDSELLVKQMNGEYRVKNEDLRDLYEEARALCRQFRVPVAFRHVRREQNRRADQLGNEALDGQRQPTPRASNTPRSTPAAKPERPSPSPQQEGLACLRKAAAAWRSGAAEPTPEQVWDQLLALLNPRGNGGRPA